MMATPELFDASIPLVLILATGVALVVQRLGFPPIMGFMLTGALASPNAFGIIKNAEMLKGLGEVGLIFLLFMVGLELSPEKLRKMKSLALRVGSLYMMLGSLALGALMFFMGAPPMLALILGGTLSLSSTALVIKSLEEAGAMQSTPGRATLGTLIVQDVALIPLLLLVPAIGSIYAKTGNGGIVLLPLLVSLAKAFGALVAVAILSFYLMPRIMDKLAQTRNRELFTLSVFSLGLGLAVLTYTLGLSLEAGAFVGGLALSGSVYSNQVLNDSRPFRDVFASMFFVSLGALLDTTFAIQYGGQITLLLGGILVTKLLLGVVAGKLGRLPWASSVVFAIAMFQVGELSFVVLQYLQAQLGQDSPVFNWLHYYNPLLTHVAVLGLFLTPLVNRLLFKKLAPRIRLFFSRWDQHDLIQEQRQHLLKATAAKESGLCPVILVGFGPVARQITEALKLQGERFHVLETNPETVKQLISEGIPALYGDATQHGVLEQAGIKTAKLLLVTVPDQKTASQIIHQARCLNPDISILSRARFQQDIAPLFQAGASRVVYDELEAGHRFTTQCLAQLGVSPYEAQGLSRKVRNTFEQVDYSTHHTLPDVEAMDRRMTLIGGAQLEWFTLPDGSFIEGKTVAEANLRNMFKINLVAKVGEDRVECHLPHASDYFNSGDTLLALGRSEDLDAFRQVLFSKAL